MHTIPWKVNTYEHSLINQSDSPSIKLQINSTNIHGINDTDRIFKLLQIKGSYLQLTSNTSYTTRGKVITRTARKQLIFRDYARLICNIIVYYSSNLL